MVALKLILIIYLNSYWIRSEEVKDNKEIKGSNNETKLNEEEIKGSTDNIKGSDEESTRSKEERLLIKLIPDFYNNYRDVLNNRNETKSLRRIFKYNREFQIHVEKLKEVNGFKKHNLIIRESNRENPLIYINNPVETKIPNAFLTLQDFKKMLTERISNQKTKFKKDSLKLRINRVPKIHKAVQEIEINMGMTKGILKKKLLSTTKSQTQPNNNESVLNPSSNLTKFKPVTLQSTIIPKDIKKTSQSIDIYASTFATSTTQATYTQKVKTLLNSTENNTEKRIGAELQIVENTKFEEKQNKSKFHGIKLQKNDIDTNILNNVTENSVDATTVKGVEITDSYLEKYELNTTELVENNPQEDEIVDTTENVTENISEMTTEYKDTITTDSEATEQNISQLEENNPSVDEIEESTPAVTTEDIPEVVTEQIEEDTTETNMVTEEVTVTTTVKTKRTRLSRPLVFLGADEGNIPEPTSET